MGVKYKKEYVEKCQKKAHSVALYARRRYHFLSTYVEDIESWVMLQFIEGRSLKTRNSFLLVDYLRDVFGDTRYEKTKPFWFITSNPKNPEVMNATDTDMGRIDHDIDVKGLVSEMEMNMPFILTAQECRVLRLFYFHDMEKKKMSVIMGVTESRISQIWQSALMKLRRFYARHLTDF